VIPEIDIWRAAQLMLKRYGEKALEESAARADELALAGDDDGATTWRRIMAAGLTPWEARATENRLRTRGPKDGISGQERLKTCYKIGEDCQDRAAN
jgi:hypothetical protein